MLYIAKQPSLQENTRAILIDWLIQIHQHFTLAPETLYLAVNILDRYLSLCSQVDLPKLQLVGITALLLDPPRGSKIPSLEL